jgi:hypothetical protein
MIARCTTALFLLVLPTSLVGCTRGNPDFLSSLDGAIPPGPVKTDGYGPVVADRGGSTPGTRDVRVPVGEPAPLPPVKSGLGTICTGTCPAGEVCLFMEENATRGICLRKCNSSYAPCSVPDPKYYSECRTYWNTDIGEIQVCMIFCQFGDSTYQCPNQTDYKCKAYGSNLAACIAR